MKIFIVPNLTKDIDGAVALSAAEILTKLGANLLFCIEMQPIFPSDWIDLHPNVALLTIQDCYTLADVIVTIGGDGTILHIAGHSFTDQKPILGVNLGRCGFLATCEKDEMEEKFTRLLQGVYHLDSRILLQASICTEQTHVNCEIPPKIDAKRNTGLALNDVVISKGQTQQAIDLSVYCDNILVESYRCDGVIIATPTGSTAYSLAAGGPIVDSQTMGIVLTAICPHKLRAPSMVFAPNRVLRVVVGATSRGEILLSCDGKTGVPLKEHETVEIKLSNQRVQLIGFSDAEQFKAIDRKLKSKD